MLVISQPKNTLGSILAYCVLFVIGLFIQTQANIFNETHLFMLYTTLFVFWCFIVWCIFTAEEYKPDGVHGSAKFASDKSMNSLTHKTDGLLIGKDQKGKQLLYYDGPGHLLTIAASRSGKGVGTIIPNLLQANRSVLCIDPKGENAKVASRARANFGKVYTLDPFGVLDTGTDSFNPLDAIDLCSDDYVEDVQSLAEALVFDSSHYADSDSHWNEEAKALLAGLVLYILDTEPNYRKNLLTLREIITLPSDEFLAVLAAMQACDDCNGLIARCANRFLGKNDKEASAVLSTLQRHTHFLDSPRMAKVLETSDFSFADLKRNIQTIFLVIPPERISAFSRWLRLLVTQSLAEMARETSKPEQPVLYLLDEFAALGRLESVERAMGIMAGYHVQLWPILQDIHQLKAHYGHMAGTFFSNAAVLQVFGINDFDTAKLVSDLSGQETRSYSTRSHSVGSGHDSYSEQLAGRPLLTADEVRNLPQNEQLIFMTGFNPIRSKKIQYFSDQEFDGLHD
jgi:type IV secretion system protein VirD4